MEREVVNSLWDSLGGLREYFTQISFTMTNYDQWSLKQKISTMENNIQKLNMKIPKTKFAFKRKREVQAKQKHRERDDQQEQDELVKTIKGLTDLQNQTITLTQGDLDSNFKLVNLVDCHINLEGCIHMLFLRNLTRCTINACPVSNSIMGHYLIDCNIDITGHQVRCIN